MPNKKPYLSKENEHVLKNFCDFKDDRTEELHEYADGLMDILEKREGERTADELDKIIGAVHTYCYAVTDNDPCQPFFEKPEPGEDLPGFAKVAVPCFYHLGCWTHKPADRCPYLNHHRLNLDKLDVIADFGSLAIIYDSDFENDQAIVLMKKSQKKRPERSCMYDVSDFAYEDSNGNLSFLGLISEHIEGDGELQKEHSLHISGTCPNCGKPLRMGIDGIRAFAKEEFLQCCAVAAGGRLEVIPGRDIVKTTAE